MNMREKMTAIELLEKLVSFKTVSRDSKPGPYKFCRGVPEFIWYSFTQGL